MQPSFLNGSGGNTGSTSHLPPLGNPDVGGETAPAGESMANDLPMTPDPKSWNEGFSPSSDTPPLPAPGSGNPARPR